MMIKMDTIPREIIAWIFTFLPNRTFFTARRISRIFNEIVCNDKNMRVIKLQPINYDHIRKFPKQIGLCYSINDYESVLFPKINYNKFFLENVDKIVSLRVYHNEYIQYLSRMTNLTTLVLDNYRTIPGKIEISHLTKLNTLSLISSNVVTNKNISTLTNITDLNLCMNHVITDDSIKHMIHLKRLILACNETITDAGIYNLTNIIELSLWKTKKVTNSGIYGLTNITDLSLWSNDMITDLGIAHLTNITRLSLCSNRLITVNGVSKMVQLKEIDLEECSNRESIKLFTLSRFRA